jgi:tetratricopeptide (TPR) repeat protein
MNALALRKLIIIIAAVCVFALLLVVLYFNFFHLYTDSIAIEESLKKIDNFIAKANLSEAELQLSRIFLKATTSVEYLQILKRFYKLAVQKNDFKLLQEYAGKAFEKIPGNEKIAVITAYAGLRTGDINTVVKISSQFKSESIISSLFSEALLRGKLDLAGLNEDEPELINPLLELESSYDPERFLTTAALYDEPKLYLDAALLYTQRGDYQKAFSICEEYLQTDDFSEPAGMISYDAGKYAQALFRLKKIMRENPERWDILIMLGDISLSLDLVEDALQYYGKVIQKAADYSVIPYVNSAFIYTKQDNTDKALEILSQAQIYFPDDKFVTLELVKLYYRKDNIEQAQVILSSYLEQHPGDFDANMLFVYLQWGDISPQQYRIQLRELFNNNPQDEKSCRILTWYLIGVNELESARNVLDEYEKATNQTHTAWLFYLKGIIEALEGNNAHAAELMRESLLLRDNWQVKYNYAVVLYASGNIKEAEDNLRELIIFFENENKELCSLEISKVRTTIGSIHLDKGNWESARLELKYALELDPKNIRAWRLLKKLEALQIK